ncbi:MAG: calcium/sodium antiporter [Bacteroidetes bacterium]|nr:calcium/sodium antiporter [Bacteroidota bacterium]
MLIAILLLCLGLVALVGGAEFFVGGAAGIARRYRVSELVIGLTIVSMGTSAPELIVNTFAAFQGSTGLAFGNIIGSNNFNLFVILGISGLITPLVVQKPTVWKEIPFSGGAALLLAILVLDFGRDPVITRIDGLVLMVGFGLFLAYAWRSMKQDNAAESPVSSPTEPESSTNGWMDVAMGIIPKKFQEPLLLISGLALLVVGGRIVVDQAIIIAATMGMSERIIGLTIVAMGTSLPELATSVVAGIRGKADIAVGNVIGSNIFNILLVLGLTGVIIPLPYDRSFDRELLLLGIGTIAVFIMMFTGKRHRLDRWEAALLIIGYGLWTGLVTFRA